MRWLINHCVKAWIALSEQILIRQCPTHWSSNSFLFIFFNVRFSNWLLRVLKRTKAKPKTVWLGNGSRKPISLPPWTERERPRSGLVPWQFLTDSSFHFLSFLLTPWQSKHRWAPFREVKILSKAGSKVGKEKQDRDTHTRKIVMNYGLKWMETKKMKGR